MQAGNQSSELDDAGTTSDNRWTNGAAHPSQTVQRHRLRARRPPERPHGRDGHGSAIATDHGRVAGVCAPHQPARNPRATRRCTGDDRDGQASFLMSAPSASLVARPVLSTAPQPVSTTHPPRAAPHLFSVDLEDWYHVSAFEPYVPRARWDAMPSRVADSTRRLLDLLDAAGHRATFFMLGWSAARDPALTREVVARGHELAAHSWWHRRVCTQPPATVRAEARETRERLEDIAGVAVCGFRAPSFSITPTSAWAFEVLVEAGYAYDSSVFPIRRPDYGYPGAPLAPYVIATPAGPLREYPLATLSVGPLRIPGAGGAYLRHLPLALVQATLRQAASVGRPAMLYVHPWEVDEGQPRLAVSALTRLRHYGGIARMVPRLAQLFTAHRFTSVRDWEATTGAVAPAPVHARLVHGPFAHEQSA
jgi:polysaccharide deacetylase family protein (PEP-CTERM system associated)